MTDTSSLQAKAKAFLDRIREINHRIAGARSQIIQIRQDIRQLAAEVDSYSAELAWGNPEANKILGPACARLREALVELADANVIN